MDKTQVGDLRGSRAEISDSSSDYEDLFHILIGFGHFHRQVLPVARRRFRRQLMRRQIRYDS